MLGLERLAVGLLGDQRLVVLERLERHVGREALLGVGEDEVCARFGPASFASSRQCTPLNVVSKRLQRVTQWMSVVISVCGSALSSS